MKEMSVRAEKSLRMNVFRYVDQGISKVKVDYLMSRLCRRQIRMDASRGCTGSTSRR